MTPDGQEIVAPLPPEVSGHSGIVRYVLMQHIQGQVTVERLLAQLKGLGVRISKGQIVTIRSTRMLSTARRTPSWRLGWPLPPG